MSKGLTHLFLIRIFLVSFLVPLLWGCDGKDAPVVAETVKEQPAFKGTIAAVGNSLTEGYGVDEAEAYPVLLEKKLAAAGYPFRVINAGISGETSTGALARINWVLTLNPDIVILETGANDGLRGIDPSLTEKNIDQIVDILKQNRVTVVLAGMKMMSNLGGAYVKAFAQTFENVAQKHDLILIPFFLEGVAADPALNQPDGIHPTAAGYRIVTDTIFPYVVKAVEKISGSKTP